MLMVIRPETGEDLQVFDLTYQSSSKRCFMSKNADTFFSCLTSRFVRFDKREFFKTPSASSSLDEASPRAS